MELENKSHPLVSIGIPVFNGERGLSHLLDALIEQGYPNVEIIVSDNASTDTTREICQDYTNKDWRVTYYRSEKNLGAIWNFNRVFELSTGKYFMWAAHDDLREPSFISACVKKMEHCTDAVLCQVHTAQFVEGHKDQLCVVNLDSFEGVTGLFERYREVLKNFPATAIYGLYRSAAMKKTRMFESVIATDVAFIQEMSIQGNFVQLPEILFSYIAREKWNTVHEDYKVFFGKDRKPWWYLPFVVLFINHCSRVASAELPFSLKVRLWWLLIKHEVGQFTLKIFIKTFKRLCPRAWKKRLAWLIYGRWMKGPNVEIGCEDLFFERVIKPRLGWWK